MIWIAFTGIKLALFTGLVGRVVLRPVAPFASALDMSIVKKTTLPTCVYRAITVGLVGDPPVHVRVGVHAAHGVPDAECVST